MCGVLFAKRRDKHPVQKALLKRYNHQSSRGKRGYGFIAIENGKVVSVERFESETEAERAVKNSDSSEILFHHRTPTSTPNYKDMTHPIAVENETLDHNYYLIHNGVLRNEGSLKTKHETMGFEYTTAMEEINIVKTKNSTKETTVEQFNDSESLAIEVARYLDGKSESIDAVGTIAFICLKTDKEGNVLSIHYGRNSGNPLVIEDNGSLFFIKSEGTKDDEKVPEDVLHSIDYKTNKLTTKSVRIGRVTFQDYNAYSPHTRQIGFGSDDDRNSNTVLIKSPYVRGAKGNLLDWGDDERFNDDELPLTDSLPTIHYDRKGSSYRVSEEYLVDLEGEIHSLEKDIRDCRTNLDKPNLSKEDTDIWETYMVEAEGVLKDKRREYARVEDALAGMGM